MIRTVRFEGSLFSYRGAVIGGMTQAMRDRLNPGTKGKVVVEWASHEEALPGGLPRYSVTVVDSVKLVLVSCWTAYAVCREGWHDTLGLPEGGYVTFKIIREES
jgi:hypothetical protein